MTRQTTRWRFATRNFVIAWITEPDDLDTNYMEKDLAEECRQKVRSGEWKCFSSTVRITCRHTGKILGEATLGNSIYANPDEFRDHLGIRQQPGAGSYFSDMVREAINEARRVLPQRKIDLRKQIRETEATLAKLKQALDATTGAIAG